MVRQIIPYKQYTDTMMEGVSQAALNQQLRQVPAVVSALQAKSDANEIAVLSLPAQRADLPAIERWAQRIRDQFSHVVVIGTGGSSLGAVMLAKLKQPQFVASSTQLHFIENSDPDTLEAALAELPLADTFFIAVSKSGGTVETMLALMVIADSLKKQEMAIGAQALAITMPGDRPLRKLAGAHNIPVLDHDPAVGGRFSVLSAVGLLPAAIAGLSIERIREGALAVQEQFDAEPMESPAVIGAALQYLQMEAGRNISVIMPYADRLDELGRWYRQLWAESIGKTGRGSTPIRAMGTVDQHSQLQLYLDGPRDKTVTILWYNRQRQGPVIPSSMAMQAGMECLAGHEVGNVMDAQQRATAESLSRGKVPVRVLELQDISEYTIGALLQHFMLETVIMAGLMGVDAFDQPAVEESKQLTRKNLSAMLEKEAV